MSWRERGHALRNRAARAAWSWVCAAGEIRHGTAAAARFAAFGVGSSIAFPSATIFGEDWIRIGAHTLIGAHATLSAGFLPGVDLGGEVLRIGNGCTIGRGSHIVAHCGIDVEDDVFTGPYCYITDQNHSYADPGVPIGRQWPVNDPVCIGAGSWLGAHTVVLPGTRLGRNVVVAAGSVVRGVVPDYSVVAGIPARVIRRYQPGVGWNPPLRQIDPAQDLRP